jgi:hypothetical protein
MIVDKQSIILNPVIHLLLRATTHFSRSDSEQSRICFPAERFLYLQRRSRSFPATSCVPSCVPSSGMQKNYTDSAMSRYKYVLRKA